MGTETRFLHVDNCPTKEQLFVRWKEMQKEDSYERGHECYRGSIANADLSVSPHRFPTAALAQAKAHADDIYKGTAIAYGYGDVSKAFPVTAADKKLVALRDATAKALENFEFDVLKRFMAAKSSSKKCGNCDSVITKKSRVHLARVPPMKNQSHFDYRDSVRELTQCPACRHELLMTATDIARKKALGVKDADLAKRVREAEVKHLAKVPPCGYHIIAAVPS